MEQRPKQPTGKGPANGSPEMYGSTRSPKGSRPPSSTSGRCISPLGHAPPGTPTKEVKRSTSPKAGPVQSRGGQTVEIGPGDVIYTPNGEEHWHGATPEHFLTHLSITEGPPALGSPRHRRRVPRLPSTPSLTQTARADNHESTCQSGGPVLTVRRAGR